jgi:hypothetical protein
MWKPTYLYKLRSEAHNLHPMVKRRGGFILQTSVSRPLLFSAFLLITHYPYSQPQESSTLIPTVVTAPSSQRRAAAPPVVTVFSIWHLDDDLADESFLYRL